MSGITANLMVEDVARSIDFYRLHLGCELLFAVDAAKKTHFDDNIPYDTVFSIVKLGDSQLMLQQTNSLIDDAAGGFAQNAKPGGSVAIYFSGPDPDVVAASVDGVTEIVKGPAQSWYGMREIYFRDLDGYLLCVAKPEGPAPQL